MPLARPDGMSGNTEDRPVTPEQIVNAASLTREEKIRRLREMAFDARALDVASGEGMTGSPPSSLPRIQEALRQLGAEDESGAAEP